MNRIFLLVLGMFLFFNGYTQPGGQGVYDFLNLTDAARIAAVGGENVSLPINDPSIVFHNPAMLKETMSHRLTLNYVNYFEDINYGYVGYAHHVNKIGTFSGGIHFINYGEFQRADETGVIDGKFYAAEYAFELSYARQLDSCFSVGATLEPVYSVLENYKSFGAVADVGVNYYSKKHNLSASFVVKNVGTQIVPYYEGHYEPVEFDIQAGITKKLKHAPLRLSLTAWHLQDWNLSFDNPNQTANVDLITGEEEKQSRFEELGDEFMRHMIISAEILLTENFFVSFGYNYQRRKEMLVETRPFMVGTSWGFGFRISKFYFSYGRACYHLAGASNYFSISTDLSSFYKKKS